MRLPYVITSFAFVAKCFVAYVATVRLPRAQMFLIEVPQSIRPFGVRFPAH